VGCKSGADVVAQANEGLTLGQAFIAQGDHAFLCDGH
jgi:hypothetical protein